MAGLYRSAANAGVFARQESDRKLRLLGQGVIVNATDWHFCADTERMFRALQKIKHRAVHASSGSFVSAAAAASGNGFEDRCAG